MYVAISNDEWNWFVYIEPTRRVNTLSRKMRLGFKPNNREIMSWLNVAFCSKNVLIQWKSFKVNTEFKTYLRTSEICVLQSWKTLHYFGSMVRKVIFLWPHRLFFSLPSTKDVLERSNLIYLWVIAFPNYYISKCSWLWKHF